jgi:hypothetical protein
MVSVKAHAILLLSLIIASGIYAQETVDEGDTLKVSPSAVLQEKVRQWVDVQKLRGKEAARWQEQKQQLAGLNELRQTEIKQIDSLIAAAGRRLEEATVERRNLLVEQAELRDTRTLLQDNITKLEKGLRDCLPGFPEPLRKKLGDAIHRLENPDADRPLQDRYRDLVAILSATATFDNTITVTKEIREVGGKRLELDTLYLGLTRAWYVGRSGTIAGHGKAGSAGWQWIEDNALSGQVQQAIEIYRKERSPDYVKLPF